MTTERQVFLVEQIPPTLVVMPQGPALNFRYQDVHRESNEVLQMFRTPELDHVLIDLGSVDYIDSVIIGSLVRMLQQARTAGGKAVFCCASPAMVDILKSVKIGTLWPLYETREVALAAITGQADA